VFPSAVIRVAQRLSGRPRFARIAPRVFPPLDRALLRLSRGRFIFSTLVAPSLMLTTTGARSGLPRESPLVTMVEPDGSFYVVGSNFGQPNHPAWSTNLLANPHAQVWYAGRSVPVRAHLLDAAERDTAWPRLLKTWPGWPDYEARSGRELRIFHLVPTGEAG
jgi:deazaflavin-dependent oxidoreductase (nitroreductase family)